MAGSFVEHVNLLASKLPIIEESNEIFDEGVIPVLEEIAALDLAEAIEDLKKGNYLGNRKIDINLILNMLGVDETLIERDPDQAEAIWTDVNKAVHYDKAIVTFVDGEVIELPFMFDGSPVTVTTHGDLLAQLARLDYVYAKAQVDSIYQLTVGNSTDYTITIDTTSYTFTSDVVATRENIIAGIANMINSATTPVTALVTDNGTKLNLTAKVPGNPFFTSVSNNMAINTIQANQIEGPVETAFLAKLQNTLAANFAEPVVGEIVRLYDVIGVNSNIERIQLNAVSGSYKLQSPIYYWAKTTSAFQTLSMRANDIIKLGNEIDNIILLAKSIEEVLEIQKRIPQLVDTFDGNDNPNGDETIYNNLSELSEVYNKLTEIITIYNDIKVGGTGHISNVNDNMTSIVNVSEDLFLGADSTIRRTGENITDIITVSDDIDNVITVSTNITSINTVSTDLNLGIDSAIKNTGDNITSVITVSNNIDKVIATANNEANINLVASEIVPNLPEILLADNNAITATNKALEATNAAALATAKANEIKNVSVGSTITGAAGTNASVIYNPANGKFTFVVPQGVKGDRGEAFQVNSIGTFAQRALYDNQSANFSYLAVDVVVNGSNIPHIYFKLSNATGDWSVGTPFGRGDKGDTGNGIASIDFTSTTGTAQGQVGETDIYTITYTDTTTFTFPVTHGKGIVDITFTSTTDVSGLAAQSGATDTYTITYTDGQTTTFPIYNGRDNLITSVAGRTGDVVLAKADVGLANVDNTTDVNKPISIATQTALNLKADKAQTITTTTVYTDNTTAIAYKLYIENGNITMEEL